MVPQETEGFRLTVLNPEGRDPEQHFADGAGDHNQAHPPVNFHAYAACTRGSFHRNTARAIAENTPVLLLLRGDLKASGRALRALQNAGRFVAVSLKETGLHQIADQLREPEKLARFLRIIKAADACLGSTPEAADFYRAARSNAARVAFIPTPYPVEDSRWNFSRLIEERAGIFIGTREWNVLSRNHLAALLLARRLSEETGERVTVYNFDGRKGRRRLAALGFATGKLEILERQVAYPDYLRVISRHKIVLQLDTSCVPGQVAGDALLCRVPTVGGNGAIDRLAFPVTCGAARSIEEVAIIAKRLLIGKNYYQQDLTETEIRALENLSFKSGAANLESFFSAR